MDVGALPSRFGCRVEKKQSRANSEIGTGECAPFGDAPTNGFLVCKFVDRRPGRPRSKLAGTRGAAGQCARCDGVGVYATRVGSASEFIIAFRSGRGSRP